MKNISIIIFSIITIFSATVEAQNIPRNYTKDNFFANMQKGDKAALLIVHFGSAYSDAREKVLDVMNGEAQQEFGDKMKVCEAYAARSIVKRLAAQKIYKQTPMEAFSKLKEEGFSHIIVQPTFAIEGIEMEVLRRETEEVEKWFKDIRIGNPLMYSDEDYMDIIDLFVKSDINKADGAKLFAAHGTYTAANASYSQLGYMCYMLGRSDFYSGTIEGFPTINNLVALFKQKKYRSITIIPCMFVLINSEHNEVSAFWKTKFEENGFPANIYAKGLGEHKEIRNIIIRHINYVIEHRRQSGIERKKMYE